MAVAVAAVAIISARVSLSLSLSVRLSVSAVFLYALLPLGGRFFPGYSKIKRNIRRRSLGKGKIPISAATGEGDKLEK